MASVSSPSMTPALPGAWASNWTLSRTYFATSDNTPKLPGQDLDRACNEKTHPALMKTHDLSGGSLAMCAEPDSIDRDVADVGDDLDDEEDFYSFVSHSSQEDTDTTLFPSSFSITRADLSDGGGLRALRTADSRPFSGDQCDFDIKDLQIGSGSSRTRQCASSVYAATLTQELGVGDGEPGPDERVIARPDAKRDMSRKRVCHSDAPMDQHLSVTSDDIHVEAQDNLASEEEYSGMDDYSERSGSTVDDAQAQQFPKRLADAPQSSQENIDSLSHSSWHLEQRRNGVENRPGALHSTSILHLAQPSGDSPWTLALDPTRPLSHDLNMLSRQSSRRSTPVSLSDESSIAFNSSQMHVMASEDRLPSPSYRQSPAARIRARYYNNEGYEIRTVLRDQQESEYSSSYSSPRAYSFPTMNSASSSPRTPAPPFIIYAHNDPPRAKPTGVIQKTKALCSKFKKIVTRSKNSAPPPPQAAVEYNPYLRRNAMDIAEHDASPPLPYLSGRQSASLNGHQGFRRTTKVSTVSVPLAQHVGHRRTGAVDVHRVCGPSVPDREEVNDTKASRRFSLPGFSGPTSSSSYSSRFSTFPSNRRPRLSMISATHID